MPTPERIYRASVRAFSIAFLVIGLASLVATLAAGGGPLSVGVLLGLAFAAIGGARLWVSTRTGH
jgi:hypothetical protein